MSDFDDNEQRLFGAYSGPVYDNEDPEGLCRVRVTLPGLVEPATGWAYPIGGVGGGTKQRGFFDVPEKNAEVVVMFLMGDVDRPVYTTGWWGAPGGQKEVPTPVAGLSKSDAIQVRVYETKRFLLVFDDRAGNESLMLKDKDTGDLINITHSKTHIKSATEVLVEAPKVELGGSGLQPMVNGVVVGQCSCAYAGVTHAALGGGSTVVMAKK